jgi:hypothetical protein
MNAASVHLLLVLCLVSMYVLAMLSLRRRELSLGRYAFWGLFALLLPAVGPFVVLLLRPGKPPARPDRPNTPR